MSQKDKDNVNDLPADSKDSENVKGGGASRFPTDRPEGRNQPTSRIPRETPQGPVSGGR